MKKTRLFSDADIKRAFENNNSQNINVKEPDIELTVKYGMRDSVINDSYLQLKLKSNKVNIDIILKALLSIRYL